MTHEAFVCGASFDQIDRLDSLLHTLGAIGDVLAMADAHLLEPQTLPTLGDVVFDVACAARDIARRISRQRLAVTDGPGAEDHPAR